MKLALVFAIAAAGAISASAATAAEPNSVVGYWSPQKLRDVVGMSMLQFTADGHVFSMSRSSVVQFLIPPSGASPKALPPPPQQWLGRYEVRDDKVIVTLGPRMSATFELTKDGRLCVFPGPGVMPADGTFRPQAGERQCYQRENVNRS